MKRGKHLKIVLATVTLGALLLGALPVFVAAAEDSPIKTADDVIKIVRNIGYWISVIFWIVAGIATLYAGFLFATAGGSQEQVGKAKKQLLYAIIAVVVGVMAAGVPQLIDAILRAPAA